MCLNPHFLGSALISLRFFRLLPSPSPTRLESCKRTVGGLDFPHLLQLLLDPAAVTPEILEAGTAPGDHRTIAFPEVRWDERNNNDKMKM